MSKVDYALEGRWIEEDIKKYVNKDCKVCFGRGVSGFQVVGGQRIGIVCKCARRNKRIDLDKQMGRSRRE